MRKTSAEMGARLKSSRGEKFLCISRIKMLFYNTWRWFAILCSIEDAMKIVLLRVRGIKRFFLKKNTRWDLI